jgi:hypothetical protein
MNKIKIGRFNKDKLRLICPICQYKWTNWKSGIKKDIVICNSCDSIILVDHSNSNTSEYFDREMNTAYEYAVQRDSFVWLLKFLKRWGIMLYYKPYHLYKN